jgi:signal recognition particle receptor subunit beta
MGTLANKIKLYVNADIDFKTDVILKDDGNGVVYIDEWNLDTAKPTDAQLNALETQANEYEANLITSKENNKESAKQKLQDLGLTVDEIKEAFGI